MFGEGAQGKKMLVEVIIFYRNMMRFMEANKCLEPEITVTELFFILYLESREGVTYYQLSRELPYDSKLISRSVRNLEEKGVIERKKDGRKKNIQLTSLGAKYIENSYGGRGNFLKVLEEKGLSREELFSFFMTMGKFSRILESEVKDTEGLFEPPFRGNIKDA